MRIQGVQTNNYSNNVSSSLKTSPSFKANVYTVIEKTCTDGVLCDSALQIMGAKFLQEAIKQGKILLDDVAFGFTNYLPGKAEFFALDKTTPLFKYFVKHVDDLTSEKGVEKLAKKIKDDAATEKLVMDIQESEYCPNFSQIKSMLN